MEDNYKICETIKEFKKYVTTGCTIILVGKLGDCIQATYLCLDYSESIINYFKDDNIRYAIALDNLKEIKVKIENNKSEVKMKDIYSNEETGIRKDYLYEIDTKSVGCILGEILNFDYSKYVVKQYKVNGEFNHYIIKISDILELHPYGTIKDFEVNLNI